MPPSLHSPLSLHDALPISVVHSAQQLGAELLLPATFSGAHITPEHCDVRYRHNGREQQVRAAMLINCAGPWASAIKDRKSTRLNSSHVRISYAFFCLKKKI